MNAWEVKAIPDDKLENYDAGIVLTGMTTYDPKNDRIEFNDRTDRLMQAVRLYRLKKINKIILSGGTSSVTGKDAGETQRLRNFLVVTGISSEDILTEEQSKNTHENAHYLKPLLNQKFPNGKFLLITSGWHLYRATLCFQKEGISVTPYSTDRYAGPIKFDLDYLFIPSAETLFHWDKLVHEWVGMVTYKLMGYI